MQPRGQLWFELERVCRDFREYSGLSDEEASETLVAVLTNLLEEQRTGVSLRPHDRRRTNEPSPPQDSRESTEAV